MHVHRQAQNCLLLGLLHRPSTTHTPRSLVPQVAATAALGIAHNHLEHPAKLASQLPASESPSKKDPKPGGGLRGKLRPLQRRRGRECLHMPPKVFFTGQRLHLRSQCVTVGRSWPGQSLAGTASWWYLFRPPYPWPSHHRRCPPVWMELRLHHDPALLPE